jgi:uncharacterized cupin superfamily protein
MRYSSSKSTAVAASFLCASLACIVFSFPLQAADAVHPVKMSKAQIAGGIFEDYEPVVSTHDGNTTHDVEVFRTASGLFDAGMYRSGKVRAEINEPYGVHEYMHFLEGGVTLTSSDGTVTSSRPSGRASGTRKATPRST